MTICHWALEFSVPYGGSNCLRREEVAVPDRAEALRPGSLHAAELREEGKRMKERQF